jgi:hypothetical protein
MRLRFATKDLAMVSGYGNEVLDGTPSPSIQKFLRSRGPEGSIMVE